jgi:hypothetical protein
MVRGHREVLKNLDLYDQKVMGGVIGIGRVTASGMEGFAKTNRQWRDRSGHARQGLKGGVLTPSPNRIMVFIAHSVSYGVHLELSYGGRYAILRLTAELWAQRFFNSVKMLLSG